MHKWENNFDYKIKEIETQFNEFHDKILMKELVEFCGIHDVFEYEVSVDMLKEALNLYIKAKENEKSGKDINVPTKKTNFEKIKEEITIKEMAKLIAETKFSDVEYCFIEKYFENSCEKCPFSENKYNCDNEVAISKWLESEAE